MNSRNCEDVTSSVVEALVRSCEKIRKLRKSAPKEAFDGKVSSGNSDESKELENDLIVCVDAIRQCFEAIDELVKEDQKEALVPFIPKLIPTVLFEGLSYCNHRQKHFNEKDVEAYGETLLEIYSRAVDIFNIFAETLRKYAIEGNSDRLAHYGDLLNSISKFAVPLTELDLTPGLMAWDLLLSLYESKKEVWYADWRPGTVWENAVTLVRTLLEKIFKEANLRDTEEENQKEIAMYIKALKAVIRVFVIIESEVSSTFSRSEVDLAVGLLAELQRYSPVILKMNDVPDKVIEFFDEKVFVACSSIVDPIGHLPETVEAIRNAIGKGLEANEIFPSLLLSLYLLEPRNSGMVEEKWCLTQSILEMMDFCNAELSLGGPIPGIQLPGQPVPILPVYEVVVTKIQAFVTTLAQEDVESVVQILLRIVQKPGWAALVASDVLVFMARYGPDSFCLDLFLLTESLLVGSSQLTVGLSPRDEFLESLTIRLGRMLAPHDTEKVKSSVYIPLVDVSEDTLDILMGSLVPVAECTVDRLNKFLTTCKCIMFNGKALPRPFAQKFCLKLVESLQMFTAAYQNCSNDGGTRFLVVLVLCSALRAISALNVEFVDENSQLKVLEHVVKVIALDNSELDSAVLVFMHSWFLPKVNNEKILSLYSQIFRQLFERYTKKVPRHSGILAKLLRCFTDYAESTKNEEVVQESVVGSVPDLLAEFLKIDVKTFKRKEFVEGLKREVEVRPYVVQFSTSPMQSPVVKKPRKTVDDVVELESCLEIMEREVEKLKADHGRLPVSVNGRLKNLVATLNSLLSK